MSNMSYCRFRNTLEDLRECYDAMYDDDLSEDERLARTILVRLCAAIASEYDEEDAPGDYETPLTQSF